jgi:hypothetical protein
MVTERVQASGRPLILVGAISWLDIAIDNNFKRGKYGYMLDAVSFHDFLAQSE